MYLFFFWPERKFEKSHALCHLSLSEQSNSLQQCYSLHTRVLFFKKNNYNDTKNKQKKSNKKKKKNNQQQQDFRENVARIISEV